MSKSCFRGEDTDGKRRKFVTFCLWRNRAVKDVIVGTYHLHGKTGNSSWKIKMVRAISFGKLQKIWALICGDAIFLLF